MQTKIIKSQRREQGERSQRSISPTNSSLQSLKGELERVVFGRAEVEGGGNRSSPLPSYLDKCNL